MLRNPLDPQVLLRSRISQSEFSATGLAGSSVIATIAAGLVAWLNLSIKAISSGHLPDRDVAMSSESGVIIVGQSRRRRVSIHDTSWPRDFRRRQPGSAAKCDTPVPVRKIRSYLLCTSG